MVAELIRNQAKVELMAYEIAGIDRLAAEAAAETIVEDLKHCSLDLDVKVVRFLPSTKSLAEQEGVFEILANVSADVGSPHPKFGFAKSRVMQAIVSFEETSAGQKLLKTSILHD